MDQLLCLPSCFLPIHLSNCFSYSQTFISTPLQCAGLYRLSFVDWLNCGIGLFDEARRSNRDRLLTAASYPSSVDVVVHLFLVNIPLIVMLSFFVLRATSRFRGTLSFAKSSSLRSEMRKQRLLWTAILPQITSSFNIIMTQTSQNLTPVLEIRIRNLSLL